MHIDNGALVGTYVSDKYSEKGTVTIIFTDGDSTPTREYTRYKYVQTEQLTAIGVAVKDYGAILVPETTLALFENNILSPTDFGVFVRFNGNYYNIPLYTLLETDIGAAVTFYNGGFDIYPHTTFNATLPPYNINDEGNVPTVDENGNVKWRNIPKELPSTAGKTGKFLAVNNNANPEWQNVPTELPTIGSEDENKVLKVKNDRSGVEWGTVESKALYAHTINYYLDTTSEKVKINFTIITDSATALDTDSAALKTAILKYLNNSNTAQIPVVGYHRDVTNSVTRFPFGLSVNSGNNNTYTLSTFSPSNPFGEMGYGSFSIIPTSDYFHTTLTDAVSQI